MAGRKGGAASDLRPLPIGVSLLAGGIDGLVRQGDVSVGGHLLPWWTQGSTYYEAALMAVSAGLSALGQIHPDVLEPAMYWSVGALASKATLWAVNGFLPTGAAALPAGAGAVPVLVAAPAGQAWRPAVEPVGVTG